MTYTQLASDVAAWSARTDLSAVIPRFVDLFESRVNRKLRLRQQETAFSGTIAANVIALPADWLEFKALYTATDPMLTLKNLTLERIAANTTGTATAYCVDGSNVRFNGDGIVSGTYYAKVPSLYANSFNWLSQLAYDAYLFGVLAEVATYQKDDAAMQIHFARSNAILDSLVRVNNERTGPLVVRPA